ncbi:hypothetical protein U9M48_037395 [Paspalum notatum var. saurae]|uniref:Sulfurtransferase n=1 Tax=Paspalum notatum var. saurae TaxID=547442 RepID=A0AAQ3X986_PASNO
MAATLLTRAAAAAFRGAARPGHLLARCTLPKETPLPPLLLLLLLLTAATPPAGRVGWAARAAEGAGVCGLGCGPAPLAGAFGIAARCNATSSSSSAVSEAAGVHALPRTEPVVSAEWLHANLRDPDVKVLDASWYMPAEQRNPLQEYQVAHIPGALFFDVDGISDRTSSLPHMLPTEKAFSAAVSALGIYNKDGIVVYDGKGLFSAARVWWMFRVFGHDKVWVLDGGLPQWRASGYDVESSASGDAILKASAAVEAIEKVYQGQSVGPSTFEAKLHPHLIWNLEQVQENIKTQTHQLIDARPKPRYVTHILILSFYKYIVHASMHEIYTASAYIHKVLLGFDAGFLKALADLMVRFLNRARGLEVGMCLEANVFLFLSFFVAWLYTVTLELGLVFQPGVHVLDSSQKLLPPDELRKRFEQEGISLDQPLVTSCGTGVTACALALGLHRLGKTDVAVYDGSWTEWGSHHDTPVATAV